MSTPVGFIQAGLGSAASTGGGGGGTGDMVAATWDSDSNGAIDVAKGGTNATSAATARSNLGVAASGNNNDITQLSGLLVDIAVADGGTGASTAAGARTNLGLGTLATQSGTFSGTSSGTNTGDQPTPTGTGFRHVTTGAEDGATKLIDTADINALQITNAKLAVGAVTDDKAALAIKPACTVVATTNQALTGTPTIDGQATAAGSLILCTAQTAGAENGPWVAAAGAWSRPTWYPTGGTAQAFQFITTLIRLGTTYQGSTWRMTTAGAITIDTTATTWVVTPFAISSSTTTGLAAVATTGSASDLGSGTLAAARTPAFTGDASKSAGSAAITVTAINGTTVSSFIQTLVDDTTAAAARATLIVESILYCCFGDGSDGALTITTGNTTTLTASKCYTNITVDSGGTLDSRGFKVRWTGTCTINGRWHCDGNSGSAAVGSASGGIGSATAGADVGGTSISSAGGAGGTGAGTQATASSGQANSWSGATAGAGGASGLGSGGAGVTSRGSGTPTKRGTSTIYFETPVHGATIMFGGQPGTGGGSGGGDGTASGGGGGGGGHGGGVLYGMGAILIVGATGVISAKGGGGGTGGTPGGTNCGGGGGGSGAGGGVVMLAYTSITVTAGGTINATGGLGGSGGGKTGTGVVGSSGGNGADGLVIRYNFQTGLYANVAI